MTANYTVVEMRDAVAVLLRGYEEELNLYTTVRGLTAQQQAILSNGRDIYFLDAGQANSGRRRRPRRFGRCWRERSLDESHCERSEAIS